MSDRPLSSSVDVSRIPSEDRGYSSRFLRRSRRRIPEEVPRPIRYSMRIARDVVAFLIRGGLSTLMFFIDMIVNGYAFSTETVVPPMVSGFMVYPVRLVVWCFQATLWFIYVLIELVFYLPNPFLLIYVILLLAMYVQSPQAVDTVLYTMFWSASRFLHLLKMVMWADERRDRHWVDDEVKVK